MKAGGTLFFSSKGNKGYAFGNGFHVLRGRRWGGTPPHGVPWPDGINLLSPLKSASTDTPRLRADCVRPAETCEKVRRTFSVCSGASQTAIETRIRRSRAIILRRNKLHLRAHTQIQKYHAARALKAKIVRAAAILYGYSPNRFLIVSLGRHGIPESEYVREGAVYSLTSRPRDNAVCAFRSLPEAEKRPAGTFSHVSADATGPREAVR